MTRHVKGAIVCGLAAMLSQGVLVGGALVGGALASNALADGFYHLESSTMLPSANPEWDYVTFDAAHGHLFIGRRDDGLAVVDAATKTLIKVIANSAGANVATLVPEFDRGYTTNEDGSSTIFRISTLETIDRIKVGDDADSAFYEPVTKQLVYTRGDSKQLSFVDAKSGKIIGGLALDSEKLDASAPDGAGNLFVAERDRNAVAKIDVKTHSLTATWQTTGCEQPTGLAYDPATRRIFVGCRGANPVLAILDGESGQVVTTLPIGRGNDGVVYDGETHKIYASNGVDANLVIYRQTDADHYALDQAITTRPYARTMALDPKTKTVYTIAAEGVADPKAKINSKVSPFYPNKYFANTFTLLTYVPR